VLAVASTWPLAARLRDGLPLGTDQTATVPLFQSWSLWWTADRVAHGFDHFWDAPIFHPTLGTFLFSDPLLLEGLLATPLIWLGATPALAHNLLLLLALVTNGAVAFGLLRSVGLDLLAAASGGAMMLMLPYVHHELGVLMLAPLSGVLATLWALLCFARTPSLGPGLLLGAAAAATYLLCGQYGLFLAVVVVPSAVWLVRADLGRPRALVALAAGAALCALLVAPLALAQLEALSEHAFGRSRGRALAGASFPEAWLVTPWPQLLPLPGVHAVDAVWKQAHFPGTLKLLLALLGAAWGLGRSNGRRWSAALLTLGVAAALFSALPRLDVGAFSAFELLRSWVPGLDQMRSYWRAIALSQIAVVLLAAQGLQALTSGAARLPARRRRAAAVAAAAAGLLAAVEVWPAHQRLSPVPDLDAWRPWSGWIEAHLEPGTPLLHLPFAASLRAADLLETSRWMYRATAHGRPMVNGYSGYFPRTHNLMARLLRGCPAPEAYAALPTLELRHLVIQSSWLRDNPGCAPPEAAWPALFRSETLDVEIRAFAGDG
jgi:hypothetical protein